MIYREVCKHYVTIYCSPRLDFWFCESKQILEYHPQMLQEYIEGGEQIHFLYPRCRFVLLIFPFVHLQKYIYCTHIFLYLYLVACHLLISLVTWLCISILVTLHVFNS
jgi:hypothetical protein